MPARSCPRRSDRNNSSNKLGQTPKNTSCKQLTEACSRLTSRVGLRPCPPYRRWQDASRRVCLRSPWVHVAAQNLSSSSASPSWIVKKGRLPSYGRFASKCLRSRGAWTQETRSWRRTKCSPATTESQDETLLLLQDGRLLKETTTAARSRKPAVGCSIAGTPMQFCKSSIQVSIIKPASFLRPGLAM